MAESSQDRKLPATQRRIDKARKEGQVARSRDLGHFASLGGAVALLAVLAPDVQDASARLLAGGLRFDAATLAQPVAMVERLAQLGVHMLAYLLPLLGAMLAAAVVAGVLSGGWNFSWQALEPKLSTLDPLAGMRRLFSGHQLIQALKASLLALVLGGAAALYLGSRWMHHAELLSMPLPAALAAGAELVLDGLLLLVGVLAAFALVDVPLQRHLLLQRLRMSVQEMKQEFKEAEGSPEIKSRLRQRMRELANRRMLAAVPLADLVVMNPTHYAVALKYDETRMAAPRVVAKGAELLALRIRDLAREHRVPVLQAPPLARALYAHTEIDAEVPARLFAAVAQVLAWVYQLRDALAAGRTLEGGPPMPDVPPDLDPANAAYAAAREGSDA